MPAQTQTEGCLKAPLRVAQRLLKVISIIDKMSGELRGMEGRLQRSELHDVADSLDLCAGRLSFIPGKILTGEVPIVFAAEEKVESYPLFERTNGHPFPVAGEVPKRGRPAKSARAKQ